MPRIDKTPMRLLDRLLALERRVWDALVAGDAQADAELLLPEFLGVYPSGFSDRAGHASQLQGGPSVAEYDLSDARVLTVGADHALLSYRARYRRPGGAPEDMYVSSLWRRGENGWRHLFSQDTPAAR